MLALLALLARKVMLELLVRRGRRVLLGRPALRVRRPRSLARLVRPGLPGLLALLVLIRPFPAQLVPLARLARRGPRDRRVTPDPRALLARLVLLARLAQRGRLVLRAVSALPDPQGPRGRQAQRVLRLTAKRLATELLLASRSLTIWVRVM